MKRTLLAAMLLSVALPSMAESNAYASLLLGNTNQDESQLRSDGSFAFEDDDVSIGLRFGYHFGEYIAAEIGYIDYGQVESNITDAVTTDVINDRFDTYAITIGAKFNFTIEQIGLSFNARVGAAQWNYRDDFTRTVSAPLAQTTSDDGTDVYYGIGMEYDVSETVTIGVEYHQLNLEIEGAQGEFDHDIENYSLSATRRF